DVPLGMPMVAVLQHYLSLAGTRWGCGEGVGPACTVVEVQEDGTQKESRTCIYGAHMFDGREIITVEGHAKLNEQGEVEELSPVQKAFVDLFAFQCSYCTPGFVTGATVFIDQLKREPVKKEDLQTAIEDALNVH